MMHKINICIYCFVIFKWVWVFFAEYCDADKKWLYFNDFCYLIVRYDSQKYSDARQKCLDKNSDLLSIHSQHESNWLLEMVSKTV
jgi:hypothetical protein